MNWFRLWLASVWLICAAVAPAHAATMNHAACPHMTMPHAPAQHLPIHDSGAMPCCSVPPVIAAEPEIRLVERAVIFIKRSPAPMRQPDGIMPVFDPRPPQKSEA